ncbi:MAG: hypothetical protein ACR2QT_11110 [Woeseiaceae bacterium]
MIVGNTAKQPATLSETQQVTRETGSLLTQKIWLPKLLYAALPCFYLVSGAFALLGTMYIGNWSWILPHYLIFSVACLHMGVLIYRRRQRGRSEAL